MTPRVRLARAVAAVGAVALSLAIPLAPAAAQTVAITGGRVHTVSGAVIENGTVLMRNGRIVAVGANVVVPAGAERVDATGKIVTPGFFHGATTLGVVEIGAVPETNDARPSTDRSVINAAVRIEDALNPASVLLAPARNEGITTVLLMPSGGLVAGQAAVIDLSDSTAPALLVRSSAAMIAQFGNASGSEVGSRAQQVAQFRALLDDARAYRARRADYDRGASRELSASRADLEAMLPVLDGRVPMLVAVDRASDILAVMRLAREYGIRLIVGGGAEAWQVADSLAAAKVPVLTVAMNNIPGSFATLGQRQENAALLEAAGVPVAIVSAETGFNVRALRQEAGNAVAYGMDWDDALRAVTLRPAQAFGIGDRYGSLEAGKVANVVVWSGDPFEFGTTADAVFVRGRRMEGATRQDALMQRYRTTPPDYYAPPPE